MSKEWGRFLSALEAKGIAFDQVRYASDRQTVICAAGISDPLSIAIVETEWARQASAGSLSGTTVSPSGIDRYSKGNDGAQPRGTDHSVRTRGASPRIGTGAEYTAIPSLNDPSRLAGLPEEIQDSVVASAVLAAALGFGGSLIVYHPPNGEGNTAGALPSSLDTSHALPQQSSSSPPLLGAASGGFSVSSYVPLSMRGLCQTVLPVTDAFVALRAVEEAEYLGRSLVGMALGETVSEITTSYAHQITKLQRWCLERTTPLMGVVSEILRVGHHIVRLRQVLPMDLLLSDNKRSRLAAATGGDSYSPGSSSHTGGGIRGPRILNYLTEQAERCAGCREDSELVSLLLRRALVPYLRLLYRWMSEGVLDDPFGEFFITASGEPVRPALSAFANAQQRSASLLFPVSTPLLAEGDGSVTRGFDSVGGRVPSAPSREGSQAMRQQDVLSFERRFSMNKLMIPSFLEKPSRTAKMVFLAGRYRCLLRECSEICPALGVAAEDMLVWTGADALHARVQASYDVTSQAVLQLLFSSAVDLVGHLRSMKRYFLQERGDWVFDFLDSAEELLSEAPDRVRAHPVRVLLQAAIARSCGTADPYHALISCSFAEEGLVEQLARTATGIDKTSATGGSVNGQYGGRRSGALRVETHRCLELLQLDVDLQWPLTLVLDAAVVARLNGVFRLLTSVKACEHTLRSLWYRNEVLSSFSAAYSIKHQLTHVLRQFLFYATHFVLEPLWSRLEARIAQADTVFAVSNALSEFLTNAESGLVLSSPMRLRSLTEIVSLSTRFCEVGRHASTATMPLIEATLQSMQEELLRALTELASPTGEDYPQLVPLLTWIDFSGFYERNDVYHVQRGVCN